MILENSRSVYNTDMDYLFIGLTFGVVGKVMLGLTVMMVHWRIVKEHRIDKLVLREMYKGRTVALAAIALITLGYILEMTHFGYFEI